MKWIITVDGHPLEADSLLDAVLLVRSHFGILELGTVVTLERIE